MKKVLPSLAVCAMVFIVSAALNSCKKDDGKSSLDGTTWVSRITEEETSLDYTLAFQKKTYSLSISEESHPNMSISITGTYTYDDPNVELSKVDDGDEGEQKLRGVRKGNTITFVEEHADTIVFKKR